MNTIWRYTILSNKTISISKYIGTDLSVVIPDEVDGYKVTAIDDVKPTKEGYIWDSKLIFPSDVQSITLPKTLKKVGKYAFSSLIKLQRVVAFDGLTHIGDGAFKGCVGLLSFACPSTLTHIGKDAFYECANLKEVVINEGLLQIGTRAFCECGKLEKLIIPKTITQISDKLCYHCRSLDKVILHEGIVAIGDKAFGSINEIDVEPKSHFKYVDCTNGIIFRPPHNTDESGDFYCENNILVSYNGFAETVIIPDSLGVVGIKEDVFRYKPVKKLVLPKTIKKLDGWLGYSNIEELVLPRSIKSVAYIGLDSEGDTLTAVAFSSFDKLNRITVDKKNPYFCDVDGVLYDKNVTQLIFVPRAKGKIDIPESVVEIREGAFCGNQNVECIKIPKGVKTLERYTFAGCKKLQTVELNDGLEVIGKYAFDDTPLLGSVKLPTTLKIIDDFAFRHSGIEEIVFNEGLEELEKYAICWCKNLVKVTLPSTLVSVGEGCFDHCESLKEVRCNIGLKSIGENAFACCPSLEKVVIPDKKTAIKSSKNWLRDSWRDLAKGAMVLHCPTESKAHDFAEKFCIKIVPYLL